MNSSETEADENKPLLPSVGNGDIQKDGKVKPKELKALKEVKTKSRGVRKPVQYISINNGDEHDYGTNNTAAVISRYKYYSRLAPHSDSLLQMPEHVVPIPFISKALVPTEGKQNSLITIFSLWNTMMGTSLLSMPWAIRQAGFGFGIVLLLFMAGLMLYTSYRVMASVKGMEFSGEVLEFSDVCRHVLGRWGEVVSVVSSLIALMGGMIVYWILMSNFLYNVVAFIYNNSVNNGTASPTIDNRSTGDAYCPHPPSFSMTNLTAPGSNGTWEPLSHSTSTFQQVWDIQKTVPFFLILFLGPLLNFKSPTFFTKFNALGTLSVAYLVSFITVKASHWGIHLDFDSTQTKYIPEISPTFPALTGIAALAYFIHNCVLSIVRNQKHPENNSRDLVIAYILVASTYIFVGVLFYASFPLPKDCIEDNLLNNLRSTDTMSFIARIGLFFQMTCVFPLLIYIFRVQFMHTLFGSVWPSLKHILVHNICLIAICLVFAVFLPHIGKIIGFAGAFCGFSYAIALPCLVYMVTLRNKGELTWFKAVFHWSLIIIGFANFVGQFLIT